LWYLHAGATSPNPADLGGGLTKDQPMDVSFSRIKLQIGFSVNGLYRIAACQPFTAKSMDRIDIIHPLPAPFVLLYFSRIGPRSLTNGQCENVFQKIKILRRRFVLHMRRLAFSMCAQTSWQQERTR
jgi:hypothetical protein